MHANVESNILKRMIHSVLWAAILSEFLTDSLQSLFQQVAAFPLLGNLSAWIHRPDTSPTSTLSRKELLMHAQEQDYAPGGMAQATPNIGERQLTDDEIQAMSQPAVLSYLAEARFELPRLLTQPAAEFKRHEFDDVIYQQSVGDGLTQ